MMRVLIVRNLTKFMAEVLSSSPEINVEDQGLGYTILVGDARRRIKELPDNSVDLIITSPPYGNIKHYCDSSAEIGVNQSYEEYHQALMDVFRECVRVLHPGCRMVINIGDQFVPTTKQHPYHVLPHASQLISNLVNEFPDDLIYNGTIHWRKVTTSNTSGGGAIMGSVYHPRNGHFFVNYEHIIVFKKLGKDRRPCPEVKEESRFTLEERRKWFRDIWEIAPETQDEHVAMFPMEIPERLIRMYSFVGETIFDPFAGSGTTLSAAAKHQRAAVGIELGFTESGDWKSVVEEKIGEHTNSHSINFA